MLAVSKFHWPALSISDRKSPCAIARTTNPADAISNLSEAAFALRQEKAEIANSASNLKSNVCPALSAGNNVPERLSIKLTSSPIEIR